MCYKKYRFVTGILILIRKSKLLIVPFYIVVSTAADPHYFYANPDPAFLLIWILIRSDFFLFFYFFFILCEPFRLHWEPPRRHCESPQLMAFQFDLVPDLASLIYADRILPPKMMRIRIRTTNNNNILLIANVEACHIIICSCFPVFRLLAQKYNCDKVICRKCYARLHPRYSILKFSVLHSTSTKFTVAFTFWKRG